ncbi:DUF4258 domain-containing protein [Brooklawnia sp.]|uniref:DUF4258 domain-containing protein n=1 Tax=Brooklawnia sp. TaxID=2699740 RepID=UPI003C778640
MRFKLTSHARDRMRERHIVDANVAEVLVQPDSATDDPSHRSVRLERRLAQGILVVWVVAPWPPASTIVVKSTAWRE